MRTPQWYEPYAGLPWPIEVLFWCVLVVTVSSVLSLLTLRIAAAVSRRRNNSAGNESEFLWVFLVPALNEEVTIADSVARLRAVAATHKMIMVIDDGSDDATPDILASISDDALQVLRRNLPDARRGKAAALNDAWRHLHDSLLAESTGWTADRVIVGIVDADGRLAPTAPSLIARHFADPAIGGVQTLVRIYNRRGFLTWAQDIEFSVFGTLFQLGRSAWGAANMGGNGQFNRLSALDAVAADEGPWRHRLTEDQDIGVRLVQAGWRSAQDTDVTIDQQGLNSLRRLYRQRTRWAQGAFESMSLLPGIRRQRTSLLGRLDSIYYLLTPALQLLTGIGLITAIAVAVFAGLSFWPSAWPMIVFYLALSFGPVLITLLSRGRGLRGIIVAVLSAVPYTIYSWLVFPVLIRALGRLIAGRSTWAKTAREPLDGGIVAEVTEGPTS